MSDPDSIPLAVIAEYRTVVETSFGLIFAVSFVGMLFLGIVVAQMYLYYTRYPRDPLWIKLFVAWVFTLDVCGGIFTIWWLYYMFISNWGNFKVFEAGNWLLCTDPLLLGLLACSVQLFFARRVKILTNNIWLTLMICACALATLAGAFGSMAEFLILEQFALLYKMRAVAILWLLPGCIADLTITISLSWFLRKKKSGFKTTDRLVDKIVRLTIQNGLLTTAVAAVDLILYLSSGQPYHIAMSLLLPRLYLNTVLSSLNSRDYLHPESEGDNSGIITASNLRSLGNRHPANAEVMVHVEAHEMVDTVKSDTDWDIQQKQAV
ncbi:hypothetical protein B0H21DRAFT_249705 [Amylocystis lapponica]|nr:hypothetical protein B0H21DRAFT_249705 [Amylocystis lapponica]